MVGSQLFPKLVRESSDTDILEISSDKFPIYLNSINASHSDRGLTNIYIPSSYILESSDTWDELVKLRDLLITKPRMDRCLQAFEFRFRHCNVTTGKMLAEITRRVYQIIHLINKEDPYLLSDKEYSILLELRNESFKMTTERVCEIISNTYDSIVKCNTDHLDKNDVIVDIK